MLGHVLAMQIARWKDLHGAGDDPGNYSDLQESATVWTLSLLKQIERSNSRHKERSRHYRCAHIVRILQPRPWIQQQISEARNFKDTVAHNAIADWMLHERIGDNDEEAGNPGTEEHQKRREPVHAAGQ